MRRCAPGLVLLLGGCAGETLPTCADETQVLATTEAGELRCAEVMTVRRYIEWLAGRSVAPVDRGRLTSEVLDWHKSDAAALTATIAELDAGLGAQSGVRGLEAGRLRSRASFAALSGAGPLAGAPESVRGVAKRAVASWASDEADELVLSELDVEAWVLYASLCREAQGGGAMRLSVANRQTAYHAIVDRFESASTAERVAMVSLGVGWLDLPDRWKGASYERQQAWINAAPLPPPMSATTLGYLQAVLDGDLAGHVQTLDRKMGPWTWLGAP